MNEKDEHQKQAGHSGCGEHHEHQHHAHAPHEDKTPRETLLEHEREILREEVKILKQEIEVLEEELEIVEIELHCKQHPGTRPPRARKYRIRVDNIKIDMENPTPTGRQILEAAGKLPPEGWLLNQKICGQIKPVGLDEKVDLTAPGIERFMTLPKDQTEGHSLGRREFHLPEEDTDLLNAGGFNWEAIQSGHRWLLVHGFLLPDGFTLPMTSAAIQIPSGYPAGPLDMIYFHPAVLRADGVTIPATQATMAIDGKSWQRWSRHYTSTNPWRSGEYNVVTHLNLARVWIEVAAKK